MAAARETLTTVVSTKGQVILPKPLRDHLRWPAGTRLTVEDTAEGVLLKAAPIFPATTLDAVFGILAHDGPALTMEDMDAVVAAEAKRRARD